MKFLIKIVVFIAVPIILISCKQKLSQPMWYTHELKASVNFSKDTLRYTNGFDYPVGKPNAKGYYNAQKFRENNHLGGYWNGVHGGNSDFGDPVYVTANGYVTFAKNIGGGWGNVIRVTHYIDSVHQVESLYAHCDTILTKRGAYIEKGTQIGTIGSNNGMYLAHLHFEIRNKVGMEIGGGYAVNTNGYVDPTKFIQNHRE